MSRLRNLTGILMAAGLAATAAVIAAPTAGAHTNGDHGRFTVVADHLNNPRGLSPAPGGGLYLAEAGSGGDFCLALPVARKARAVRGLPGRLTW